MATQLPQKLRIGEVQRFASRAVQLEKFRPIVTYWCEYYILQYVLNRNLHTTDDECQGYALQLMDKLEQYKADNAANDAIVDDVAAKAYIENFAMDTFNRADNAQRANNVTKQTADTFMAAATFLDLLAIWGEVDREIAAKSKFAKFHAARILKAFKAGEDPNATNPVAEEAPAPAADEFDDELNDMEQQQNGGSASGYQQPTVEDAGPSGAPSRPESAFQGQSPAPPPMPLHPPNQAASPSLPVPRPGDVSPIEPHQSDANESASARQNSVGGGYFPEVPGQTADVDMSDQMDPPPPAAQSPMNPQDFYNTNALPPPAAPSAPSPGSLGLGSDNRPSRPSPSQMNAQPPAMPFAQPPPAPPAQSQPLAPPAPPPAQYAPPAGGYKTDDDSSAAAQKHARWAISALNFEDVNTAVKELRLALQSLGAT
ncbi:uncharacterized protein LTR77_003586 [Saxophila tyrrhenica]|uniref:DUF605-domain-containing protein n=1 Tax=Saxophila tyrrhenica TaxID=1690608 RepID=A0AAV9PES8_9PEZI|nr:hypothetical protein LTR77_003586 [Saxophila tyrrhenica]